MDTRKLAVAAAAAALIAGAAGCKDKQRESGAAPSRPADIEGMAAIPSEATAVLGLDIARLADSPLVDRAIEQMLVRDPELRQRLTQLIADCRLDPARDLEAVIIAMGSGPGEALLVARGRFSEGEIAACVGRNLAASGGRVSSQIVAGRTAYHAEGGPDRVDVWFSFGSPTTLIVSRSPDWLARALDPANRPDPELSALAARADTKAAIWAAGRVAPAVGKGLLSVAGEGGEGGPIRAPPRAFFGELDLGAGVVARLGADMADSNDAKSLVSLAKPQLAALSLMAQRRGLGRLVRKIEVDSEDSTVYLRVSLTPDEVRELAARIDTEGGGEQDLDPDEDREGAREDGQGDASPDR